MTSLYSVLICLVCAVRETSPASPLAAAIASTPYYQEGVRQRSDPLQDRAEELFAQKEGRRRDEELMIKANRERTGERTFESDKADEHFGRAFQHGEFPGHVSDHREHDDKLREHAIDRFASAMERPMEEDEDEIQMRRGDDFNHRRRQPALLDDPRRPLTHGWEAPHGKWEHRDKVGDTRWEHRAGKPHRAETMSAQISDRGEVGTKPAHSMVERNSEWAEGGKKALALLGESTAENAEAGSEGVFGALKEGFESLYTVITITDYPYMCPCDWAKRPDGSRQQLTMKEGGKCITAHNEACAKQSAGRVGLLLLAALPVLVGRE